jgi:hypothetical protein
MQKIIKYYVFGSEMWGQAIGHLKVSNVQPHLLPNLKLYVNSYFIGMLLIYASKSFFGLGV